MSVGRELNPGPLRSEAGLPNSSITTFVEHIQEKQNRNASIDMADIRYNFNLTSQTTLTITEWVTHRGRYFTLQVKILVNLG
jgi:hypothetical protein